MGDAFVSQLLFATGAKFSDGEALGRARRVRLRIFDDGIEVDHRRIAYAEIEEVVLISIRQLFVRSFVLRVESAGKTLKFGVSSHSFWRGELPFAARRVRGRVRLHPVVRVLRLCLSVLLVAAVVWLVWSSLA
ncbi:MAG: hypothetical protein ACI9EF_000104 [Pseudohongiellaceae bacterium]